MSENRLKCPDCEDFRYLSFKKIGFKFEEEEKIVGMNIPYFSCKNCKNEYSLKSSSYYEEIARKYYDEMTGGDVMEIQFEYENKRFNEYEHLGFSYSSEDYYLIPGLERPNPDAGYLTPVFFDKDVLLYYNYHPNYSVELTSFSSSYITYNGESFFKSGVGFGINRNGNIFKWLGDLAKDFESEDMQSHLLRFRASNIPSDHDIYSKFYISQLPSVPEDEFQEPDNENKLFILYDRFKREIEKKFNAKISKTDIIKIISQYRYPLLEEKEQIFNAYLVLNKYLVESLDRNFLEKKLESIKLKEKCKELKSLKLLELFLQNILKMQDADKFISPLFVLNDLRNLKAHIAETSYKEKYNSCKKRLAIPLDASDFKVYRALIDSLINFYEKLIQHIEKL